MKLSTIALVAVSATAMAAPVAAPESAVVLSERADNTLYISGSNATQLAKDYVGVYSLSPGAFATDVQQPMGFLDFSGYVQFIAGLLYTGSDFIKNAAQAVVNVNVNELNTAITNALLGFMKYLNAFLQAVQQGTRFDKAVYAFIINSGIKEWLTKVGLWIMNLSNTILGSPLLQSIVDVLKQFVQWLFKGKQTVQQTLGSEADQTGFNRAILAANSVQAAAQKKIDGGN